MHFNFNLNELFTFNLDQYIPYSPICDLFSRNLETYLKKKISQPPGPPTYTKFFPKKINKKKQVLRIRIFWNGKNNESFCDILKRVEKWYWEPPQTEFEQYRECNEALDDYGTFMSETTQPKRCCKKKITFVFLLAGKLVRILFCLARHSHHI